MQYQKKAPQEVIQILKKHNVQYIDIFFYAWPSTFASTAGPCDGIGGCAMSSYTIEAYVCDDSGPTVYVCAGRYHFEPEWFQPFKKIKRWEDL